MCGNKKLLAVVVAMAMNASAVAQQPAGNPPSSLDVVKGTIPAGLPGVSAPAQNVGEPTKPTAAVRPAAPQPVTAPMAPPAPATVAVKMPPGYVPQATTAQAPGAAGNASGAAVSVSAAPAKPVVLPAGGLTINTLAKVHKLEMEKTVAKKLSDLGYSEEAKPMPELLKPQAVKPPPKPRPYVQFVGGPVGKEFAKVVLSSGEMVEISAGQTAHGIHVASISNGRILVGNPSSGNGKARKAVKQAWVAPGDFIK